MRPIIIIEIENGDVQRVMTEREVDYLVVNRDKLEQGDLDCPMLDADEIMSRTALMETARSIQEEYKTLRE